MILEEVRHTVRSMIKKAQIGSPGLIPTPLYYASMQPKSMSERTKKDWAPGGPLDSSVHAANMSIMRGIAKGVKEAIPGTIDFTFGNLAGLLGGSINKFRGGKFSDGYFGAKGEVRNITDNIRRVEMALGGNMVRNGIDSLQGYHLGNIERQLGPMTGKDGNLTKDWKDYAEYLGLLQNGEGVAADATEMAVTWPMYGKFIKGLYGTQKANQASRLARLTTRARHSAAGALIPILATMPSFANYVDSVENPASQDVSADASAPSSPSYTPEQIADAQRKMREIHRDGPLNQEWRIKQYGEAMDVLEPGWRDRMKAEQDAQRADSELSWLKYAPKL